MNSTRVKTHQRKIGKSTVEVRGHERGQQRRIYGVAVDRETNWSFHEQYRFW
jgi:hypothetical protein